MTFQFPDHDGENRAVDTDQDRRAAVPEATGQGSAGGEVSDPVLTAEREDAFEFAQAQVRCGLAPVFVVERAVETPGVVDAGAGVGVAVEDCPATATEKEDQRIYRAVVRWRLLLATGSDKRVKDVPNADERSVEELSHGDDGLPGG
ncbi:hypothetical protein FCN18_38715 [Prauserella endophytica]|uniref:Uncharacterized protein n=1 Tax=Prauserella endophytica TaxID=1592324 RepID=A0ABY2RSQ8_9PSEU|nr:hypothetical protein FCN18_38715 [Prauserella endophytica]